MKQRGRATGQPVKGRGHSAVSSKARKTPTAHLSTDHSPEQFDRLKRERDEALEQLAATSEVLQVISSTPGDLEPVFQSMLANAVRICEAKFGTMLRAEEGGYRVVAMHGPPPAYAAERRRTPVLRVGPTNPLARVAASKQLQHIADIRKDRAYLDRDPAFLVLADDAGARTLLMVPMLKENKLIGAIAIYRQEVRPFTDKQVELVKSFAAQAVIAIENTRLLSELRQRTDDLSESLEQQTATSEVLKVISSSPGELEPVFQAMLENATRICEARFGNLVLYENDAFRMAAMHGAPPEFAEKRGREPIIHPSPKSPLFRVAKTRQLLHIIDLRIDEAYVDGDLPTRAFVELAGTRTIVVVPMLKDDKLIGAIGIYRQEVRPFTDKQIELLKNFAAQAVIAIENTRLLNELRQRTGDLSEALEQQTATSEVLRVISSSPSELTPVFQTMLANATRLCQANFGTLNLHDNGDFPLAATHNVPEVYAEYRHHHPIIKADQRHPLARVATSKQVLQIANMRAEPLYLEKDPSFIAMVDLAGARTLFIVPMLKENELVGVITIFRQELRPFTDKQIELVKNFAAQAVIAIENTRLLNELRQRTDDLSEALEQQTATSEVLKVISSSPGELEPVFQAMLENAMRICEAKIGTLYLREADAYRAVAATHDAPAAYVEARRREPNLKPPPDGPLGQAAITKRVVHMADIMKLQSYIDRHPAIVDSVELGKFRTALAVPLLKDDELIGAITIMRQEVRPFTDKQIELVQNFAAQAVIAIENTRLLSELRQRTDDLSESLEQQVATSDVLRVISSSPTNVQPVFDSIAESAVRLCDGQFSFVLRFDGKVMDFASCCGLSAEGLDAFHSILPMPASEDTAAGRAIVRRAVVEIPDVEADPSYGARGRGLAKAVTYRSIAAVPLLNEGNPIGAIAVARANAGSFPKRQIVLLQAFADQAVIAIKNVRLFDEVQARTRELSESLQQQTATSEVLSVISSSPGELEPVFNAMLENAVRICGAKFGNLMLAEGDALRTVALYGAPPEYAEARRREPLTRHRVGTALGQVLATKQPAQIADIQAEPAYYDDPSRSGLLKLAGARTVVAVPMLKEHELVGAIFIYRQEVRPFTEKQIELVKNFAAQAVIAIENTRLLNELRESLQQQTATADVLKVISRSTFDLRTVLQTLVESAARLCDADKATITRQKDGAFYSAETYGFSPEFMDYIQKIPIVPERGLASGRALLEGRLVHIPDVKADPEYTLLEGQRLGDYRTILAVPMLREGTPIGVLILTRSEVRPFTDKQIELVSTFADQAAIAIENVRLFESVEARTRELAKSLEDLRTTQDRLVQTQKLASLGQLTAGIAHEIKNPLNFVNNFSGVSAELIDELRDTLKGPLDDKARAEINELTDTLRSNLDKVMQHGKRADAIVKNMLLHSREGSGEHRAVDINALVEESLNLAYHGARAEKQGFNITLQRSFDSATGEADVFPQDITRVLLNLILNGFYAATKRKTDADSDGYEPFLAVSTRSLGDRVEITVRDNGAGISPEVKDKMFNPFFTTKPAGEGTGLGLSISHDIIVKQHGGSIEVETEPGEYTEFRIILPRAAAFVTASGAST